MRRLSLFVLITTVALLVLGLGLKSSASLARRVVLTDAAVSRNDSRVEAQESRPGLTNDGSQFIIRFASNPQPMPPFLLPDLDGQIVSTASWRGKVVLLNFWATWCPPCREEIPEMIELSRRFKDHLQIVGVSEDDAPGEEIRQFARNMGIDYPIVMGNRTLAAEYGGVPALPTSFVVNTEGRIVQKHEGVFPINVYDAEVRSLLGMPVDAKVETFEDIGQIFLKNAVNAKDLPGVDFKGLTDDQKRAALKRMNSEFCTCGCRLTIAQCRINESECTTSQHLAENIVHEIRTGSSHPAAPVSNTIRQ